MTIDNNRYTAFKPRQADYFLLIVGLLALVAIGAYSALTMEHFGHLITGMNNQVVWGLPHVFAISLIVTASGALNGATLSSVFGISAYKPYGRISVVLAMSLLVGGLLVLVLDLGRPDRLIVAMTKYNFKSIFTWNIFLYTGFIAVGALYLWMMVERRFNKHTQKLGYLAFVWRLVLTTGTGSIFGFLVGRNSLDSALLAPLFIALSFVMGTAVLALVLAMLARWHMRALSDSLIASMNNLLKWFLLALLYFSVVHHLTNLYVAEHHAVEKFTLAGPFASLFWAGHVLLGIVLPFALLVFARSLSNLTRLLVASIVSVIGGAVLLYVIIIGSQSTPQILFPDKTVISSTFGDAGFALYSPSLWEWGLGVGGVALALLLCVLILRVFPFTPEAEASS